MEYFDRRFLTPYGLDAIKATIHTGDDNVWGELHFSDGHGGSVTFDFDVSQDLDLSADDATNALERVESIICEFRAEWSRRVEVLEAGAALQGGRGTGTAGGP